jgi:thiamine biosynthesis lipoprotein
MAPDLAIAAPPSDLAEHRFRSMGCDASVLVPADRPDAVNFAREVLDTWEARFSRFRPDSELERLNDAAGRPVRASEPMLTVLRAALRAARATDGLFDPLLGGRLIELGYDHTFAELPRQRSSAPLAAWRAGAWRQIAIDEMRGTVLLPVGHRLDLGGIAKGMAVDAALGELVAGGMPFAAVNVGGDLAVARLPPGSESWTVAIDGPPETLVALRSGALATSSVLRRRWGVDGVERHHLLDPRNGMPAAGPVVQASVAAATCGQAEVAAKLAILSDLRDAIGRLEQHRLAALLMTSDGTAWRVGAWQ